MLEHKCGVVQMIQDSLHVLQATSCILPRIFFDNLHGLLDHVHETARYPGFAIQVFEEGVGIAKRGKKGRHSIQDSKLLMLHKNIDPYATCFPKVSARDTGGEIVFPSTNGRVLLSLRTLPGRRKSNAQILKYKICCGYRPSAVTDG